MIIDFNEIPAWCKLWVFPSSRKFYDQEISSITETLEAFLNSWTSNNEPIKSAYQLKYERFIIIAVDNSETSLSLKAHDQLSLFILELEKKLDVILLDKINVCYKQGEFVQYKDLIEFKKLMTNKSVSEKTIVFDNMITTKEELENDWEINITDSWLGRFLK
ncbi:ABC transporter ATPase [Lutibacter sp. HS1-25]|uniref:ABC transporter ATPase n=1 Tax=Lutibacter sp. HS1-25 TaxID=2485000 RepID=UPI0010127136|nr:ABC transporter ATPase [Lutibacter sp. HS1-25]RXP44517.1 ABC transporter ATPase [Lutibacter sp. HS1-25]